MFPEGAGSMCRPKRLSPKFDNSQTLVPLIVNETRTNTNYRHFSNQVHHPLCNELVQNVRGLHLVLAASMLFHWINGRLF